MKTIVGVFLLAICAAAQPPIQEPLAPPDNFFDSNGVRIRYLDQGHGPPVVLIHGYTGSIERHWIATGVFANLVKDHRVIALDCRGHGKSGKPTDPKAYGAEMAQDIVRLLDHLKIQRAHVVGFSMGAMIAGRLLITNADRLLTVAFVGHHPVRKWTTVDEQEAEASARELEGDLPFRSLILGISPPDAAPPTDDEIRALSRRLIATNDLKALAAFHRGRRTLTVTDAQLAAVRVPTLEIIGSADPNLVDVQELRKVMRALKVVVVDGASHGGERGVLRRTEFLAALHESLADRRGTVRVRAKAARRAISRRNTWLFVHSEGRSPESVRPPCYVALRQPHDNLNGIGVGSGVWLYGH